MPFMPTVEVTDEQANRLLAAFGSIPEYKDWLRAQLVNKLRKYELEQIQEQAEADKLVAQEEVINFMTPPDPEQ